MLVPPKGPHDAKILIIGEAPWKTEVAQGEPFVGASGNLLNRWLAEVGLDRLSIRVDNLCHRKPPKVAVESLGADEIISWVPRLHERIAKLTRPHVIVPLGNYATFALTGKGKVLAKVRNACTGQDLSVSMSEKKAGITSLRGSTYIYEDLWGREIKVIPSIHPAAVLRNKGFEKRCLRDWRVIKEESESIGFKPTRRNHLINPNYSQVKEFTEWVLLSDEVKRLSVDIETSHKITCIGFATSPYFSITIPWSDWAYPFIKALCECNKEKILQNGFYDTYWLDDAGISVNNWLWDTLAMHHSFDPAESHGLAFLASYFTRQNYWKDEAKDADEIKKYVTDWNALQVYNGLDCTVTYEVWEKLRGHEDFKEEFYHKHYQELFQPLLKMMRHGVRVDWEKQREWAKTLMKERKFLLYGLQKAAGEDLMAKKDFSNPKLRKFLYETLKLPKQMKQAVHKAGRARVVTADETAIKRLTQKFSTRIGEHGLNILKCRSLKKKADVMRRGWDKDGRIRCSYKFTTEQGRLASSKNPQGKGYNLQNVERENGGIRSTFLSDRGTVFVRIDLSQVESRVAKMYCATPRMRELANTKPWEYDEHTDNAQVLFKVGAPSKEQRQRGKIFTHAGQRAVSGQTIADMLLKQGTVMTSKQCEKILRNYHKSYPEYEEIYFPYVRGELMREGVLENSWGRVVDYRCYRFDNDLWKKGYSFYLQSEAMDLLMQQGIKPLHKKKMNGVWLQMQVHDEMIASCEVDVAYDYAKFVVGELEKPVRIRGAELVVPACVTVGASWDGGYEFKRFTTKGEFDKRVREVMNA